MGFSDRQLLWRIELPLALPEIIGGLRIATVSTVAIASLAFFAGGGGLGEEIYQQLAFLTNIILAGGILILMAMALDASLLALQYFATPWRRVR
jgi:osmoprotectant transport system permease protein